MGSNAWLGGESQDAGGGARQTRWLTPPELVAALGPFDLDPCGAPGHELALWTYLLENGDDGLRDPWSGRVFVNPPYGRAAEAFLSRCADHGDAIALIFARTETRAFIAQVWERADAILFLAGRLTFLDAEGVRGKANAGAPSCLVAYGSENVEALRRSGLPGRLVVLDQTERIE